MATNFMTLNSEKQEPKKKTIFEKQITASFEIINKKEYPDKYKNVLHLGKDKYYGDVFKVWNDDKNDFLICFGTAGDEFKK